VRLAHEGAAIIDLGAEASSFFRPGIAPVPADEQLRRLQPVLARLHDVGSISIDTRSAEVVRALARIKPIIVNDISAGTHDPGMLETVAALGCSMVLMHMSPTFPDDPARDDRDIVETVGAFLDQRLNAAMKAGIGREQLLVDPGLGFGKTAADNWRLVLEADRFLRLGCPVVMGASRKRFLQRAGEGPQHEVMGPMMRKIGHLAPLAEHERDMASAAATAYLAQRGIPIHRVHNLALAAAAMRDFA